jgi:hypothetical protein
MLGGKGVVEIVDWQEAGGQQAQVGSLKVGVSGVLKRKSSMGRVIGLRRRWKALLGVSDRMSGIGFYLW